MDTSDFIGEVTELYVFHVVKSLRTEIFPRAADIRHDY